MFSSSTEKFLIEQYWDVINLGDFKRFLSYQGTPTFLFVRLKRISKEFLNEFLRKKSFFEGESERERWEKGVEEDESFNLTSFLDDNFERWRRRKDEKRRKKTWLICWETKDGFFPGVFSEKEKCIWEFESCSLVNNSRESEQNTFVWKLKYC